MITRNTVEKSTLERHIQTVLTAIAIGLLTWNGVTLLDLKEKVVRMEVHQLLVPVLQNQINVLGKELQELRIEMVKLSSKEKEH
jgi:hypothetical protein